MPLSRLGRSEGRPGPASGNARAALVTAATVTALVVVAVAPSMRGVAADCPNMCSGNGVCDSNLDYCTCDTVRGYYGSDCSLRRCPMGLSWVDSSVGDFNHDNVLDGGGNDRTKFGDDDRPQGTPANSAITPMWRPQGWWERHPSQLYGTMEDNSAGNLPMRVRQDEGHFYTPCSNRGICDPNLGVCVCFTGYEGAACNRTSCPNDCSGHGTCEPLAEVIPSTTDYRLWDADLNRGCVCDAMFTGPDCSQRKCYHNDDPLTPTTTRQGFSENIAERGEVQRIRVGCANNGGFRSDSSIRISYTDVQFGDSWETGELNVGATSDPSDDILAALRGLPNQVLASQPAYDQVVSVTRTVLQDARNNPNYIYAISFHHRLGDVAPLTVDTSGMKCRAGIVLPVGAYRDAAWIENTYVTFVDGNGDGDGTRVVGPEYDATLTLRVESTANNDEQYSFSIETLGVAGTLAASSDSDTTFSTAEALLSHLWPVKLAFPEGNGGLEDFRGAASAQYVIEFKAPVAAVTVTTPPYETSATTMPITYGLANIAGAAAENLYIEFSSPFDVITTDVTATVTNTNIGTSPHQYDWSTTGDVQSATGVDHHDGWSTLAGATTAMEIYKVKVAFEHGAEDAGRSATSGQWVFNGRSGFISGDQSATNVEAIRLRDNANVAFNAFDSVHIEIEIVALNAAADAVQAGGANTDVYSYKYNGVEMGVFRIMDTWQKLGNTDMGQPSDVTTIEIMFGAGAKVSGARSVGDQWRFVLTKIPVQASWGYTETFRIHYFNSDSASGLAGRVLEPTEDDNIAFVFNILETNDETDTYRWKLATDEVWTGSAAAPLDFSLGTAATTGANTNTFRPDSLSSPRHDHVLNFALYLSGGLDLDTRQCGSSNSNSWYYLQTGSDGINDSPECSDRGVCNRNNGRCECFGQYGGVDCSEQHLLAF